MLTWCTMPVPGGTTLNWLNACCPQRRNANRSLLRWNSRSTLRSKASGRPNTSATTEWSMTSSAGTSGLILAGSPPRSRMASRRAARSTTAGTPVRSYRMTRAPDQGLGDRHPRTDPHQVRHRVAPGWGPPAHGRYLAAVSGGGVTLIVRLIEYHVHVADREPLGRG